MRRVLLPLLDGTDRIGVMELVLSHEGTLDEPLVALSERYAHFVAQLIVTKSAYGDAFEVKRRTRPMDVSAELMWQLLPPRVFASDDVVVAGLVEPCYASGGDCFDYAVNGRIAHLAIFDAMGHGLVACGASSLAVSAYRSARRRGLGLVDTYVEMDLAVRRQDADRHVTAVFAELDLDDGRLRWVNAGHPEPLLLRHGKVVKTLRAPVQTPLGIPFDVGPVAEGSESLEPGDQLLLYTDGLPEARQPDGEFLTVERLGEFVERQAAAGYPAPETLRRLRHAVLTHQHGQLQDDASALLVEWRRGTERRLLPPTVTP
jgi:serine phosphatase RsbU (regulator of sigma subunit)